MMPGKLFNLKRPIILAPMAGVGTPELCAAVSNCGGLGSLPTGYLTRKQAEKNIRKVKKLTSKPFAVNLFIPEPIPDFDHKQASSMIDYLNEIRLKLSLKPMTIHDIIRQDEDIDSWISLLIRERVSAVSFTFGSLTSSQIKELKRHNIVVMGTATHVAEAFHLKQVGCDAIIAQGYEAGGHQGTFLHHKSNPLGTMALVPQIVDAVPDLPVIAAGGISDGRGVLAAISLGAGAVQLGTAFIPAHESCASDMYKKAILNSRDKGTRLTRHISGKFARALDNDWIDELEKRPSLPYPLQHYLTSEIRTAFVSQNHNEMAAFWSGQGAPSVQGGYVEEVMERMDGQLRRAQEMILSRFNQYR
ncbi:NAD(P)H-dependent flavin oxidoreductase [Legionella spiritensis]|uniref:NAD(P)H-dependent flavin oxidoreductase n=1 Tax=Legionella spiritensis TaxID=452 RepID=UPI000F831147|nr:nitronate monooxygenase [Legionella spiritensis]